MSFFSPQHDHKSCVNAALESAEKRCVAQDVRLTPIRRRVLELVWANHKPAHAYDLMAQLQRRRRKPVAPPTVYRALEFLQSLGLVHRIESLNAYIGCVEPDHAHSGQFLICTECESVAELDDPGIGTAIKRQARETGFAISHQTVEVMGKCPSCCGARLS